MKKLIYIVLILFPLLSLAQKDRPIDFIKRNTVYFEYLGQGYFYSLNYDRIYKYENKMKLSYTIGVTYLSELYSYYSDHFVGIPISYNLLLGRDEDYFQLGLGFTPLISTDAFSNGLNYTSYFTPKIGYRHQSEKGGFYYGVVGYLLTAFANYTHSNRQGHPQLDFFKNVVDSERPIQPWVGLSIGGTF